ncbi:hypothetical protein SKAU_G00029820 [Synaphobranchus kaupii]|uniref:Uncharacterized protein n=1 Tax=Synaphobranchus kaupii TaxID=118154 RepID=A0A9Q1GDL0_SYNKA|nr:hypothetical protein SKAU_G00029820 [Synaphobranchus kaupii]
MAPSHARASAAPPCLLRTVPFSGTKDRPAVEAGGRANERALAETNKPLCRTSGAAAQPPASRHEILMAELLSPLATLEWPPIDLPLKLAGCVRAPLLLHLLHLLLKELDTLTEGKTGRLHLPWDSMGLRGPAARRYLIAHQTRSPTAANLTQLRIIINNLFRLAVGSRASDTCPRCRE